MKPATVLLLAVLVAVTGCAAPGSLSVKQTEFVRTIPTCSTPKECERKWAAARQWVLDNCGWKLQHVSDDYLETYNPTQYSTRLAARVVKEPLADGTYRIVATLWCDNFLGCVPDKWDAALAFNRSVNAVAVEQSGRVGILVDRNLAVTELVPGGSAERAGLQLGDRVLLVDGRNVAGLSEGALGDLIMGDPGTVVDVTVLRGGERLEFLLERELK